MQTFIYMARHAESPFILGEERTRPLSAEGEQAAERLAALLRDAPIDIIISSPYERAIQTVEPLAHMLDLDVHVYEQMKERQLKGDFRLSNEEIYAALEQSFDNIDFSLPEGESVRDVQNRAIPLMQALLQNAKGQHIVIGTHGNIMTSIMHYYDTRYDYAFWRQTSKPDLYRLTFEQEQLVAVERLWQEV